MYDVPYMYILRTVACVQSGDCSIQCEDIFSAIRNDRNQNKLQVLISVDSILLTTCNQLVKPHKGFNHMVCFMTCLIEIWRGFDDHIAEPKTYQSSPKLRRG